MVEEKPKLGFFRMESDLKRDINKFRADHMTMGEIMSFSAACRALIREGLNHF